MFKIAGLVAVVVAFIGGAYLLNQQATLPIENPTPVIPNANSALAVPETDGSDSTIPATSAQNEEPDAAPSEPARYPVELQGIVYDTQGQPAQNVSVNIRLFTHSALVIGQKESKTPLAEQTVRPDANGYVFAQFSVTAGTFAEWRASVPGAYAYLRTIAGPVTNRNAFSFQLIPTGRISGRVLDANGNLIDGATVRPFRYESTTSGRVNLMPDDRGVSTTQDGTYVLDQLYEGHWKLLVEAPGHASTITPFTDTGVELDITLVAATSMSGIVMDEDANEPISDLRLVLVREDCWLETHETVTDDEGRYAFPSLAPAVYTVYPIDRQRFVSSDHAKINVRQSESDYMIEMRRGAVITGRVTDSRTGQPIAGVVAAAGLVEPDADSHPRTHMRSEPTLSDGVYMIEGLPTGKYRVGFSGASSLPSATDAVRETLPLLDVDPGQVYSDIDFAVDRLYPVSGVVRDPKGNPLDGVSVLDYDLDRPERYRNMYLPNPTLTEADGRFIRWIPEATGKLVLRAISGKWASRDVGPMPVGAGGLDNVELTAYPAGRIFGMLQSSEGMAIPSADVVYEAFNSTAMRDVPENERSLFGAGSVWTDDRGRFCVVGLPPDDYTFTYRGVSRTVTLGFGEAVGDVIIQLTADGSAAVEGTVFVLGEATEGVSISFSHASESRPRIAISNNEGHYRLSGVPSGEMQYNLDWRKFDHGVEISRHLNGAITVPARGLSTLDFELARETSAIEGVLTENGNPRPRAQFIVSLQWDDATLEWIRVVTNDEGYYRIDGLPAGEHDLILDLKPSMPNDEPHSHRYFYTVQTADGQTTRHDVTFDMGSLAVSYSGIGANEQGRLVVIPDVADAEELTLPKALSLIDHALFDAEFEEDGSVSIDDVPAGTHTMLFAVYDANVESDEERFASTRYTYSLVDVVPGQETPVSFALPK